MKMRASRGFTLVEVLVALIVLSLAALMIARSVGSGANNYSWIDSKVRAWMVASDKLVEMQVYQQFPPVGTSDGREERFGETWKVRTRVTQGPYPDTRRVDIEVGPEAGFGEEASIYWTQSSLLGKPHESDAGAAEQGRTPVGGNGSGQAAGATPGEEEEP